MIVIGTVAIIIGHNNRLEGLCAIITDVMVISNTAFSALARLAARREISTCSPKMTCEVV